MVIVIPLSGKAYELENESKIYFHDTLQIWHPQKEKLAERKNVGGDFSFLIKVDQ